MEHRLLLFEGLPGSGKSTAAHHTLLAARAAGLQATWHYEEERDHPIVLFRDQAELRGVVDAVFSGRHAEVIARALTLWRRLGELSGSDDTLRLLDGHLFGNLGWTLHAGDVPPEDIERYFDNVFEALAPCRPLVVWFSEPDVSVPFQRLAARGGQTWLDRHVDRSLTFPYAVRRGLQGQQGAQQLWDDYQRFVEEFSTRSEVPLLSLTSEQAVAARTGVLLDRLALPSVATSASPSEVTHLVGEYVDAQAPRTRVTIHHLDGHLRIDGLPGGWPSMRLLRIGPRTFALESYPAQVAFVVSQRQASFEVECQPLWGQYPAGTFVRTQSQA